MPTRGSPICDRLERSAEACARTSIQQRSALEFSIFGRNPNDFVNLDGRLVGDVGWQGKFQGVVRLPWGLQASASLDAREGASSDPDQEHSVVDRGAGFHHDPAAASRRLRPSAGGHHHRCPAAEGLRARSRRSARRLPGRTEPEQRERAAERCESANVTSSVYQYPSDVRLPAPVHAERKIQFLRAHRPHAGRSFRGRPRVIDSARRPVRAR